MAPSPTQEDAREGGGGGGGEQDEVLGEASQPRQEQEVAGEEDEQEQEGEEEEEEEAPTHLPFAPPSELAGDVRHALALFVIECASIALLAVVERIRGWISLAAARRHWFVRCARGAGIGGARFKNYKNVVAINERWHSGIEIEDRLFDVATTVDPSYIISLIRQLLPQDSKVEKEFSVKQGFPEESNGNSDAVESTNAENKDPWEECGCILWDLAASKPQAELMMNNLVLEVLLVNLHVSKSSRVKEICLGIIGNLACHESLINAISLQNGLIETVVDQLFSDDSACLSETFRLLATIIRSSESASWAEALLPDEILSRVLWIVGNTLNSTLFEKSIDFLSAVIDNEEVAGILLQPLIKVGLVSHAISLLTNEIEKSGDENKLERSSVLDLVLRFNEALSAIDNCSQVMSSNDQLFQGLCGIVKSPDKFEIASYCASAVIIIANLLADGRHHVPALSHDFPFLEGLFDILPLVSDDNQARNALWCILAGLLTQTQENDMNSSSLDQFASLFLDKFSLLKVDLENYPIDKSEDDPAPSAYLKYGVSTSLRGISSVMEKWIAEKSTTCEEDSSLTDDAIGKAQKLLNYCQKYGL